MLYETLEYLGIAFISSVLLIIMSKIILQALIRRPADYYNAEELREEELMLNAGGISITSEHETNPEGEIIENAHLEAKLGESEPAEPEAILPEIPDSVHQSIEIVQEESAEAEPSEESVDTWQPAEPENNPDSAQEDEEIWEPAEKPVQTHKPAEEQYGFSIKARTSRNKKPKDKGAEEAEEELEQAKAVIDEARTHGESSEPVSEWTESYADIRKSLENAFTDKAAHDEKNNAVPAEKKKHRRYRAPSMNMNKRELTDIAVSRGITVPEGATKREILDLIYSNKRNRY